MSGAGAAALEARTGSDGDLTQLRSRAVLQEQEQEKLSGRQGLKAGAE